MRINLKVPFSQKDAAKELGARWDATRKIWYVVDPECLEVFSDWMPQAEEAATAQGAVATAKSPERKGVVTGPQTHQPLCHCNILPWEHCEHSLTS